MSNIENKLEILLCFEKNIVKIWRNFDNFIDNFESVLRKIRKF